MEPAPTVRRICACNNLQNPYNAGNRVVLNTYLGVPAMVHDNENGSALRTIVWSEICPWLAIFRTFRLATGFRVLLLSAVAVLLTACVWSVLGAVFGLEATKWVWPMAESPTESSTMAPWVAIDQAVPDTPELVDTTDLAIADVDNAFFRVWVQLTQPLWGVFQRDVTRRSLPCLLLCGLCSLAICAYFGGAITRIAAVQLAAEERLPLAAALRFACRKWPAYFVAPLVPLLGVALAAAPIWILGLLMHFNWGVLLAGIAWPVSLVAGAIMAVLLLGLIFGWPLMWTTISTEGTDSFDAMQRSYSYVFQRPLHYLFYALVAALFGMLSWLLVKNFAAAVIALTYGAAGYGCGPDQIDTIAGKETLTTLSNVGPAGAWLIRFWVGCVKLLAVGFLYGYFWTAVSAIYLLLRRNVDTTEMDEVFLDEDAGERSYGLPPIRTDAAGAPIVDDTTAQPADDADAELPDEEG